MLAARYTITQAQVHLSASLPVRMQSLDVVKPVPPHDHEYYEICFVRSGSAVHRTRGGRQELRAGQVIVVAPGMVHMFEKVTGLKVTNVYYLGEWLLADLEELYRHGLARLFLAQHLFGEQMTADIVVLDLTDAEWMGCQRELSDVTRESKRPNPNTLLLRCALIKLLCQIGRAYTRTYPADHGRFMFDPRVQVMLDGIEAAVLSGRPIDLSSLAGSIHVSPNHAARLFRAEIGSSPTFHFQRRRIQRVALLLLGPDLSITEIAQRTGFTDHSHLARCFHRHMKISPRAYRSTYRANRTESSKKIDG